MHNYPRTDGLIDFQTMSKEQALAFLNEWIATTPERRSWLQYNMIADGFDIIDANISSLTVVGEWLASRAKLRENIVLGGPMPDLSSLNPETAPLWYDTSAAGAWMFDDWTMRANDAAALNFGHVMTQTYPDIQWTVAHEPVKTFIDQNRPCLISKNHNNILNPIAVHVGLLLRNLTKGPTSAESIKSAINELLGERSFPIR